jgi:hypothetical protein
MRRRTAKAHDWICRTFIRNTGIARLLFPGGEEG